MGWHNGLVGGYMRANGQPRRTLLGGVAVVGAISALCLASEANALTFEVTKRGDPAPGACMPKDCSLREAIAAANAAVGPDRVKVPSRKRYQLSIAGDDALSGDLDVTTDPLEVFHPGKGRATIDNNVPGDGLQDPLDRIFDVQPGAPLTLTKLTITDGGDPTGSANGGGIWAKDDLALKHTNVVGNEAPGDGGGIYADDGALSLHRSRVSGNHASGGGGGIYHSTTGPISGALMINRSSISGNRADSSEAGGVYFSTNSNVESSITNTTISGNRTTDEGGGLYADLGRLTVSRTTLADNRAESGGGMSVDGPEVLLVVNSTVAGNGASGVGGGINAESDMSINAVTVARNVGNTDCAPATFGGGLYVTKNDAFTVENSLIGLNALCSLDPDDGARNDCAGEEQGFASAGENLLSTVSMCAGFNGPGDLVRNNPRLGRLADNGGPTRTVALLRGSAAINAADPATSPPRDQRGVKRRSPDIGAFERR